MGKLKTKKTLIKRVKISKNGKIVKKATASSHNKRKWSASKRFRKLRESLIDTRGIVKKIKKLLPGR
jgi:ribosomal protein L35